LLTLICPWPISANKYWRPVHIGKHITIVPTKEAKAYREDIARGARMAGLRTPIAGRVRVAIELYPQRPQDWVNRARLKPFGWDDDVRCIDLDNATKVLFDALKGVAFGDDKFVFEYSAKRMEPDGEARVVVRIEPIALPAVPELPMAMPIPKPQPTKAETLGVPF